MVGLIGSAMELAMAADAWQHVSRAPPRPWSLLQEACCLFLCRAQGFDGSRVLGVWLQLSTCIPTRAIS
jgi:hypothetical protein